MACKNAGFSALEKCKEIKEVENQVIRKTVEDQKGVLEVEEEVLHPVKDMNIHVPTSPDMIQDQVRLIDHPLFLQIIISALNLRYVK